MLEIMNPKKENGEFKNYKVVIDYDFEEDGEIYEESAVWGYFDSIKEVKEYLTEEVRDEIKEYYGYNLRYEIALCSVNRPFPDEFNIKRMRDTSEKEDGMIFCPYCGKWRLFFENEDYDSTCIVCGVSEKNYDVERYKYMK